MEMQSLVGSVMQQAIMTVITVSLPVMVIALVIGIIISVFQATTQINEQTLSFVPKMIGIFIAILVFGSWMLTELSEFTVSVFDYIKEIG